MNIEYDPSIKNRCHVTVYVYVNDAAVCQYSTNMIKLNQLFLVCIAYLYKLDCVKSVRIWSYSGPQFSRIFPHSDGIRRGPNAGK